MRGHFYALSADGIKHMSQEMTTGDKTTVEWSEIPAGETRATKEKAPPAGCQWEPITNEQWENIAEVLRDYKFSQAADDNYRAGWKRERRVYADIIKRLSSLDRK